MQSIPYFIIAFVIVVILWRLGWRPLVNTSYYTADYIRNGIGLVAGEMIVIGFDIHGAHKDGCGGWCVVIAFNAAFGIWRDPYRSRNSSEYMDDKRYPQL